jgi:hypothetical protein
MDPAARVRAAIKRVDQLRPIIEPILREESVPPELSAVVLVESGGSITALSPKGARGVWQFMPDTARRYGLVVPAHETSAWTLLSQRVRLRSICAIFITNLVIGSSHLLRTTPVSKWWIEHWCVLGNGTFQQ